MFFLVFRRHFFSLAIMAVFCNCGIFCGCFLTCAFFVDALFVVQECLSAEASSAHWKAWGISFGQGQILEC